MTTKYRKGIYLTSAADSALDVEDEENIRGAVDRVVGKKNILAGAETEDRTEIIISPFPLGGKPFSALNTSLVPEYFDQPQELFDEFGFRLPVTDGTSDPTAECPPLETSTHRMQWLALVQSTNGQLERELLWANVDVRKVRETPKFEAMVRQCGIPHSLRPFLWPRLSGATTKREKSPLCYAKIVGKSEREGAPVVEVQIEKDLLRTLPSHFSFSRPHSPGIAPLRRLLRALAFMFPELGYCQGMGIVAGSLLLVCCEENAFWMMCALVEDILPPSYYAPSLLGVRADERVLAHLVQVHMPELGELLRGTETGLAMVNWLITLLAASLPARALFRLWDQLFVFGPATLFRVVLALLKLNESRLLDLRGTAKSTDLFAAITRLPAEVESADGLLEMAQSFDFSVTDHLVRELRKKYQGILMFEKGVDGGGEERKGEMSTKQRVTRRKLHRSRSVVRKIFERQGVGEGEGASAEDDPRTKNIRQTELVLDLRNAILQICAHFADCKEDQHRGKACAMQANFSAGFDYARERELFLLGRREGRKRARALTDFEQKDRDDLGFRRNDLITVLSERDEHCWVGELDGRRGWFPAKFVQLLDERGKDYCASGDEAICPRIAELVRGPLTFALRQILCHGIRSPSDRRLHLLPSQPGPHPWPFIESLSKSVSFKTDPAHQSRHSRLTLCNTFRLDQDGRVLGPEELLLLAVGSIGRSHDSVNAPLDAKLRSLVAFGLNEQCLHLWFDLFCNGPGQDAQRKSFHSWSFIRSPASQQISCELKLLAQFAFSLDVDSEIVCSEELSAMTSGQQQRPRARGKGTAGGEWERRGPLKQGVQDMLIKHHLFSWDL